MYKINNMIIHRGFSENYWLKKFKPGVIFTKYIPKDRCVNIYKVIGEPFEFKTRYNDKYRFIQVPSNRVKKVEINSYTTYEILYDTNVLIYIRLNGTLDSDIKEIFNNLSHNIKFIKE